MTLPLPFKLFGAERASTRYPSGYRQLGSRGEDFGEDVDEPRDVAIGHRAKGNTQSAVRR
jgi:hypothetical protein